MEKVAQQKTYTQTNRIPMPTACDVQNTSDMSAVRTVSPVRRGRRSGSRSRSRSRSRSGSSSPSRSPSPPLSLLRQEAAARRATPIPADCSECPSCATRIKGYYEGWRTCVWCEKEVCSECSERWGFHDAKTYKCLICLDES